MVRASVRVSMKIQERVREGGVRGLSKVEERLRKGWGLQLWQGLTYKVKKGVE
jgi:hypothetical protein